MSYVFPFDSATIFFQVILSNNFTEQESDSVCVSIWVLGPGKIIKYFLAISPLYTQVECNYRPCALENIGFAAFPHI